MSEHLVWNTKELKIHKQTSQLSPPSELLHGLQIKPALGLFHQETKKKQTKKPNLKRTVGLINL